MPKVRTTLTIDDRVLKLLKVRAARIGKGESELIEELLRRQLGLEMLDRMWAGPQIDEDEAVELAVEGQHRSRPAVSR